MALITTWDALLNAGTAGLLALFGAWIWTLKPRTRASRLLALFAVAHGLTYVALNLWETTGEVKGTAEFQARQALLLVGYAVSAWALLGIAREQVAPRNAPAWRAYVAGVACATLAAMIYYLPTAIFPPGIFPAAVDLAEDVAGRSFVLAFGGLPLLFAWMFSSTRSGNGSRAGKTWLALGTALVPWPGIYGGDAPFLSPQAEDFADGLMILAAVLASGVLWLVATQGNTPHSRKCRNAALLTFGVVLISMVNATVLPDLLGRSIPLYGIARVATVVLLGHAILRHQALGFDVGLRFAISKSTLAAVFVAVFFVASEAAQQFFGDRFESGYLGILAAGALVFVFAPLSRVADRIAERAVPVATAAPTALTAPDRREDRYRDALRFALRDGRMSREEEAHLFHLAEDLGIGAGRAMAIRQEVEAELGRGDN